MCHILFIWEARDEKQQLLATQIYAKKTYTICAVPDHKHQCFRQRNEKQRCLPPLDLHGLQLCRASSTCRFRASTNQRGSRLVRRGVCLCWCNSEHMRLTSGRRVNSPRAPLRHIVLPSLSAHETLGFQDFNTMIVLKASARDAYFCICSLPAPKWLLENTLSCNKLLVAVALVCICAVLGFWCGDVHRLCDFFRSFHQNIFIFLCWIAVGLQPKIELRPSRFVTSNSRSKSTFAPKTHFLTGWRTVFTAILPLLLKAQMSVLRESPLYY